MIFLLSPAKSLDFDTPVPARLRHTQPVFPRQTQQLIAQLRTQSAQDLAELMDLSDTLASLNAARYAQFSTEPVKGQAKQAVLAFNGAVYEGLSAKAWTTADLSWAQAHLRILSGLYGVLKPLDWILPHRLEMGTRLRTAHGHTLYEFWGSQIAQALNEDLMALCNKKPVVVNLASVEYARSVDRKALDAQMIDCVFEERHGERPYKVIGVHAKRARGLMARFAVLNRVNRPSQLRRFGDEGYIFDASASSADRLVFRRTVE